MQLDLPQLHHKQEYLDMIQEFLVAQETILPQSANMQPGQKYEEFVLACQKDREQKWSTENIPHSVYFLMENKKIVWVIDIRHQLNDTLRYDLGNIGYGIRPSQRRKWYATIGLKLALEKCREMGMNKVLLTVRQDNIGSIKAIILNWGVRDSSYEINGNKKDRYRIIL